MMVASTIAALVVGAEQEVLCTFDQARRRELIHVEGREHRRCFARYPPRRRRRRRRRSRDDDARITIGERRKL